MRDRQEQTEISVVDTIHLAGLLTKVGQMGAQIRANNKINEALIQRIERKSIRINRKENP